MKKSIIINGKLLEKYFEMDADNLDRVKSGNIENIEIIIDEENKSVCYIEVTDDELRSNIRNGNYIDDDYNGVLEFLNSLK